MHPLSRIAKSLLLTMCVIVDQTGCGESGDRVLESDVVAVVPCSDATLAESWKYCVEVVEADGRYLALTEDSVSNQCVRMNLVSRALVEEIGGRRRIHANLTVSACDRHGQRTLTIDPNQCEIEVAEDSQGLFGLRSFRANECSSELRYVSRILSECMCHPE